MSTVAILRCSSCQAPVRWVKIAKSGRLIPLDPEPAPAGNVRLLDAAHAEVVPLRKRARLLEDGTQLYLSHFATCPNAAHHRKPRGQTA